MEQSFFISFPNRKASLEHSVATSTLKYQNKKKRYQVYLSVCENSTPSPSVIYSKIKLVLKPWFGIGNRDKS